MDLYSTANQQIRKEFVNRELTLEVTSLVEELLSKNVLDSESIIPIVKEVNDTIYMNNQEVYDRIEEIKEEMYETEDEKELNELQEEIELLELDDWDQLEVLEYYVVSNYLANKLESKGELIIREYDLIIWGRTCSGQSTYMDEVIGSICNDVGLLK